jgi:hypothetical protein
LPAHEFAAVQVQLQKRAEHAVLLKTFNPEQSASVDAIEGMLILSAWSAAVGPLDAEVQDGAVIATTAVRMAMTLHLDQASKKVLQLRSLAREQNGLTAAEKEHYDKALQSTRLVCCSCFVG